MSCIKLGVLGSSSYGTVFLAEFRSLFSGSPVFAVKSSQILRSYSLQVEGVFLKALIGSDFIVQSFGEDVSLEDGRRVYNLLLEYAPGGTLENLIQSRAGGNIPESEISRYAYQLLRGIHDVHRCGIVHCDLKPCNVLVFHCRCGCGANHLKIANFGLAKPAGRNILLGQSHRGTLRYTSPESVMDRMHEAPKDIWAVGCMVAEMITGKSIWKSICKEELKWNIALKEPEIPEGISDVAKDFLKRCFERDPNSRLPAELLLLHPFIAIAKDKLEFDHLSAEVKNPFGEWVSEADLFFETPKFDPSIAKQEFNVFDDLRQICFAGAKLFSRPSIPKLNPLAPPPFYQHVVFPEMPKKKKGYSAPISSIIPAPFVPPSFDQQLPPSVRLLLGL